MSCLASVAKIITNTCSIVPVSGLEVKGWLLNRRDATFTEDVGNDVLITAVLMAVGTRLWPITAVKKENNAGFDLISADNIPDQFNNYFSFQPYERDALSVANFNNMDDVVAIVELKGPKTVGCFVILGYNNGLHKSSVNFRANDNNGIPTYEMQSREGESEKYSRRVFWDTDYDTTKAALVTAETPTAGP